jgi:uncharacterized alpha-E superfamily protein
VAEFLILDDEFPRSVRSCVRQALLAIAAIRATVRPKSVDPTERILGRLDAQLEYADPTELISADGGLPRYLSGILDGIAEASLAVQRSFFLH